MNGTNSVVTFQTCDDDNDKMLDFWEMRNGLDWTDRDDMNGNPDSDPFIKVHEYWLLSDPWTANTNANYAFVDAINAVDDKIAGLSPTNALEIFSIQDHANTNYVRNTNCGPLPMT